MLLRPTSFGTHWVYGSRMKRMMENFPLEDRPISSVEDHRISPV